MKLKTTLLILCTATFLFAEETPRQFRVWGEKARMQLGAVKPVYNKRGIKSIRIPKGFKRVNPENNKMPKLSTQEETRGFVIFNKHYMDKVYTETVPSREEIGRQLKSIATPGEYVTMSFCVRSLKQLNCVQVDVSDLKNKKDNSFISNPNIDLRIIRYLPVKLAQAKKYIIVPKYLESFDEFDILNMQKNQTERFWLTIHIPAKTVSGVYSGSIRVSSRNSKSFKFRYAIKVLPFKLLKPDPYTEMNFSILSNDNDPRFTRHSKDVYPENMHRHFVDMVEHGMNTTIYQHVNPDVRLKKDAEINIDFDTPGYTSYYSFNNFMYIYKKAGFTGPYGYYSGPYEWSSYMVPSRCKVKKYSKKFNMYLRELFKSVENHRKTKKWPEFIYFLGDEPGASASRVKLSMNLGKQMQAVIPKVESSNFFNGEWGGTKDWLILKPVTTINCTNFVTKRVIDESKKAGYKALWIYNGCSEYKDDYRGYRLFYGFHPWKIGAKGVTQYKYQTFNASPALDYTAYDQINNSGSFYDFTYPSPSGPLPTQKWESIRQGIYDYRYAFTLFQYIKKAKQKGMQKEVAEAKAILENIMKDFSYDFQSHKREEIIKNFSPLTMDIYRWKIAKAINRLHNVLNAKVK